MLANDNSRAHCGQPGGNQCCNGQGPHRDLQGVRPLLPEVANEWADDIADSTRPQIDHSNLGWQAIEEYSLLAHQQQIDLMAAADETLDQAECDSLGPASCQVRYQKSDLRHPSPMTAASAIVQRSLPNDNANYPNGRSMLGGGWLKNLGPLEVMYQQSSSRTPNLPGR